MVGWKLGIGESASDQRSDSLKAPADFAAGAAREQQASPQAPKLEMPKIGMPKIQMESLPINNWILKLKEYWRVLKIAKKPDMSEFKTTAKAAALGIAILGVVGFIIAMIAQLLTT